MMKMKQQINVNTPWAGLGMDCKEAKTLNEVLAMSNLNFKVEPQDIVVNGQKVPGYIANVRSDTNEVLGIVGKKYEIIQSEDAFSFIDGMVDEGMRFTSAGVTRDSKKVWILGELQDVSILGDDVTPYLYFENSFDGSGSIQLNVVMLRQWCANGMTYLMKDNRFSWSIRHTKAVMNRLELAHRNILNANQYIEGFTEQMELLQQRALPSFADFKEFIFPVPTDITARKENNIALQREQLETIYNTKEDIKPFLGTQYGAYLAITDMASHAEPLRQTESYNERRFLNLVKGNEWVGRAQEFFKAA